MIRGFGRPFRGFQDHHQSLWRWNNADWSDPEMGSVPPLLPPLFPSVPSPPSLLVAFKTALLILVFLFPGNGNQSHEDYTMFRSVR